MCSFFQLSFSRPISPNREREPDIDFLIGLENNADWEDESDRSLATEHKLLKKKMSDLDLNELYEKCNHLSNMAEVANRYVQFYAILYVT